MNHPARDIALTYRKNHPHPSAFQRVERLAHELKSRADEHPAVTDAEVGVTAALWHLADGLRNLALLGRAEACEMVLARALTAFEGETGAG